ncbi:MAG TPA: C1 family peptidase [Bacteroidales bacterium]|nr:C1 family peptidase [Bacteroidales bacterium]
MKKQFIALVILAISVSAFGQNKEKIEITKELKTTPVKNQAMSSTCWSFATISFLESELLRMGKGEYDLSEMFYVRKAYPIKAYNFYHFQGKCNFGPGGQAHDITYLFREYGAVPEKVYSGLKKNENHNQLDLDDALLNIMDQVVKKGTAGSEEKWKFSLDSAMDVHLGKLPQTFNYDGKNYTPQSFGASLGIDPDNYVELTSYSHHPFYQQFVLEVPDNWMFEKYYNLPIDELINIMDNSINKGYTFCWDGDVSDEISFSDNGGVATLEKEKKKIEQSDRQKAFEDFSVTDDHLMHITGIAKSDFGGTYYLTKNSWGGKKGNNGYWFMSENYVRLKTIAILVHKDAIPKELKDKLGIK